jgi:hypothetical protein
MPNKIKNILTFDCSKVKLKEILEQIQDDEAGIGSIDFNKIIPMPESLHMESGSSEYDAISLYLTSINPNGKYIGTEKVSSEQFSEIDNLMKTSPNHREYNNSMTVKQVKDTVNNAIVSSKILEGVTKCPEYKSRSFNDVQNSLVYMGKQYTDNVLNYGCTTWYDWRIDHWGTKWSAHNFIYYVDENTIIFDSAWSAPIPIIKKLIELFPDVVIKHKWAGERMDHYVGEE